MKCARKGCNNAVPPSKRKYCSEQCCKVANQARLNHRNEGLALDGSRLRHRKSRVCLMCNKTFMSSGPWNRLCPVCKPKAGSPHRVHTLSVPRHWLGAVDREAID